MAKKYPKLSSILKKLLFEKNMNAADLAREIEIPQPTIHRLVSGKSTRPYKRSLEPIAEYFSISVSDLLGEPNSTMNPWKNNSSNTVGNNVKNIPIISWLKTHKFEQTSTNSNHFVVTTGDISACCFALITEDYSMEPLFTKNSILLFDCQKKPIDRSYVLVELAETEKPIFRQLIMDGDMSYLKALNPDLSHTKRKLNNTDKIIATLFESRFNHNQQNFENLIEEVKEC